MRGWVGPQLNKFEQIFSNDHQMSVAKGWTENREEGRGRSHVWYPGREVPYLVPGKGGPVIGIRQGRSHVPSRGMHHLRAVVNILSFF